MGITDIIYRRISAAGHRKIGHKEKKKEKYAIELNILQSTQLPTYVPKVSRATLYHINSYYYMSFSPPGPLLGGHSLE